MTTNQVQGHPAPHHFKSQQFMHFYLDRVPNQKLVHHEGLLPENWTNGLRFSLRVRSHWAHAFAPVTAVVATTEWVPLIDVCTDTCVFYQSVLEKKKRPIGQMYCKGRNVTSQTPVVSMTTRLVSTVLFTLMLGFCWTWLAPQCRVVPIFGDVHFA